MFQKIEKIRLGQKAPVSSASIRTIKKVQKIQNVFKNQEIQIVLGNPKQSSLGRRHLYPVLAARP